MGNKTYIDGGNQTLVTNIKKIFCFWSPVFSFFSIIEPRLGTLIDLAWF
jgi:hypothetical protein